MSCTVAYSINRVAHTAATTRVPRPPGNTECNDKAGLLVILQVSPIVGDAAPKLKFDKNSVPCSIVCTLKRLTVYKRQVHTQEKRANREGGSHGVRARLALLAEALPPYRSTPYSKPENSLLHNGLFLPSCWSTHHSVHIGVLRTPCRNIPSSVPEHPLLLPFPSTGDTRSYSVVVYHTWYQASGTVSHYKQ